MLHTNQNNLIQPNNTQVIQQGINYQIYNMSGSQTIDAYQIQEANKLQNANNQLSGQVVSVAPVHTQAWNQVNNQPQVLNQFSNQPASNTSHHQHQMPNQVQMAYYGHIPNQVDMQTPYQVQISHLPMPNVQHQVQIPYSVQSAPHVQIVNPAAAPQVQYQIQTLPQSQTVHRAKNIKPVAINKQVQTQISAQEHQNLHQINLNYLMACQKYQVAQKSVPKPGRMYATRGRPSKKQKEMRAMLMKQSALRNIYPNTMTVGLNKAPLNYPVAVGNTNYGKQYQPGKILNNYGQQQVYTVQQPIGILNNQKQASGVVNNINYGQYNQYVVLNQQSSGPVNNVGQYQQHPSLVANNIYTGQYPQQSNLATPVNNQQILQQFNGGQSKVHYQQVMKVAQTQPIPRNLNQRQLQAAVEDTEKCGAQKVQNDHTEIINIDVENLLSIDSVSVPDVCNLKEVECLFEEITSGQFEKPEGILNGNQESFSMATLQPPNPFVESSTTPTFDDISSSSGEVSVDGVNVNFNDLFEFVVLNITEEDMVLMADGGSADTFNPLTPPETPFLN